jgi:hypothetical protein
MYHKYEDIKHRNLIIIRLVQAWPFINGYNNMKSKHDERKGKKLFDEQALLFLMLAKQRWQRKLQENICKIMSVDY